jgi:hypothetical protein
LPNKLKVAFAEKATTLEMEEAEDAAEVEEANEVKDVKEAAERMEEDMVWSWWRG